MKQTIEEIEVVGKRVLMRVDFNVPLQDGVIVDDHRIRAALPSIQNVLDRGGALTLISHLGRPSGNGFEKALSMQPVAIRLSELLDQEVVCSDEDNSSPIILRENLRFNVGEKSGDVVFAKKIAEGADIYCNDAFGTAHRNHASMVAVPEVMQGKPRVAGLLLAKELQFLQDAIDNAERPFVAVLGGAKVSDKMGAIEHLLGKVDAILIGKNTAQVDDPSLTVRLVDGKNPIRVIADTSRTLPQNLKIFNDNESETIVLCSSDQFSDNKTTHCKYIVVKEKNKMLDPQDILKHLANMGITSILLEGGPKLIQSFYQEGLIDEVYEYTAPVTLNGKDMLNPISIDDSWDCKDQENLGEDKLVIYQKKEVECLVE